MNNKVNEAKDKVEGKVKEVVGNVTDDKNLETEGLAQQAVGKLREGVEIVKDKVEDAVDKGKDVAEDLADKGKDVTKDIVEKGKETIDKVVDTIKK